MTVLLEDPIVVAPTPTPYRDDDSIDHNALSRNIERLLDTPLSGFVLTTANGEEEVLSEEEKVEIVRTTVAVHGGRRLTIAGIDTPSRSETVRLAERYVEAGADLVRLRLPRGLAPEAVAEYFNEVTPRSPVPVVIIHQKISARPAVPPELLGALCAHDNVFAYITDVNIRYESFVRTFVPPDCRFWICNGALLSTGMLMGANGACMWLGNVAPALCMEIVNLGYEGRFDEARPLQEMATVIDGTVIQYDLAGVKTALDILGFEGMRPRLPLPPLGEESRGEIREALVAASLVS